MSCSVAICHNSYNKTSKQIPPINYHRFPRDPKFRKIWTTLTHRADKFNFSTGRICSIHFTENDFYSKTVKGKQVKCLKSTAVPTLNLLPQSSGSTSQTIKRRKLNSSPLKPTPEHESISSIREQNPAEPDSTTLKNDIAKLQKELQEVKQELNDFQKNLTKNFKGLLSARQILAMGKSEHSRFKKYSEEEIVSALEIRALSPKVYRLLKKKLPIPAERTLYRWISCLDFSPGLLYPALEMVKIQNKDKTDFEKLHSQF